MDRHVYTDLKQSGGTQRHTLARYYQCHDAPSEQRNTGIGTRSKMDTIIHVGHYTGHDWPKHWGILTGGKLCKEGFPERRYGTCSVVLRVDHKENGLGRGIADESNNERIMQVCSCRC